MAHTPPARWSALMLIAVAGSITLATCTKEIAPQSSSLEATNATSPTSRLRDFAKRASLLNGAHQKSGAILSQDSAIWYIEGALNFSLANTALEYSESQFYSLTVSCTLNSDGSVDESEAMSAFNAAYAALEGITTTEQHLVMIDAQGTSQAGQLIVVCVYAVGSGYEQTLNTSYTPQDDYMWWNGTSLPSTDCPCGDNLAVSSYCADKVIQHRINDELTGGVMGYWMNVEMWSVGLGCTDPSSHTYFNQDGLFYVPGNTSGHSNQDYMHFWCEGSGCDNCLDETDMGFHTQGAYDAMILIRNAHTPTKDPIMCKVHGDLHHTLHLIEYYYGVEQRF